MQKPGDQGRMGGGDDAASVEQVLKALESRATEAERRLRTLEQGPQSRTSSHEIVQTLQVVRELLYKAKERQLELEKKEATLVKERTQNQAKLTALEGRNSKLEYQILQLKRAVKAGDSALQAAHPQH
ncbi:hypothetical protein ABBQ38_012615 [Trebouxia sp. C0009 RCD-2024]